MKLLKSIQKELITEASSIHSETLSYLIEEKLVGMIGGKLYLKDGGKKIIKEYDEKLTLLNAINQKMIQLFQCKSELEMAIEQDQQKHEEPQEDGTVVSFKATLQPETSAQDYINKDMVCPSCLYKGPMQIATSESLTTSSRSRIVFTHSACCLLS